MFTNVLEKLEKISLFRHISDEKDLKLILDITEKKEYKAGDTIIKEGEPGNDLFIINQGSVEVLKHTMQKDEKYTVVNLKDEDNVFFGEQALLDSDTRSATVIANTDCGLLVISRDKFDDLSKKKPELALTIVKEIATILSTRLRKANKDIITLFEALVLEITDK